MKRKQNVMPSLQLLLLAWFLPIRMPPYLLLVFVSSSTSREVRDALGGVSSMSESSFGPRRVIFSELICCFLFFLYLTLSLFSVPIERAP